MEEKDIKLITEIDQRSRSNTKRLDRMEQRQDNLEKLTETVATMQVELRNVVTMVGETKDAVKELEAKPAKRWDTLVAALISALVGIALGLLFRAG